MSDDIRLERADGWATIWLQRPERRNALTGPMFDQLADAVDELSADDDVAAVLVRGAGHAFCSGIDLTELQARPQHQWVPHLGASSRRAHVALYRCQCPIVVALERFAINAGSSLALAADLLIAGASSFLQIGEIRQGANIPMNAAWLRLKTTEPVMARLALLGDRVPADELLRLGLVHQVTADEEVVARATVIAERLAGFPAGAARSIKADLRRHVDIDPDTWFASSTNTALLHATQLRE